MISDMYVSEMILPWRKACAKFERRKSDPELQKRRRICRHREKLTVPGLTEKSLGYFTSCVTRNCDVSRSKSFQFNP